MTNRWRLTAIALATILLCSVCVGLAIYLHRQDLRWLVATQPPPPPSAPRLKPPPPPPEPEIAAEAPAPPAVRHLSWKGLKVGDYTGARRLNPDIQQALGRLDQDLLDAIKDLKDLSGLFPTATDHITIVPMDRQDCGFDEAFRVTLSGGQARVELPIEPLVLGWWRPRQVLSAALAAGILIQEVPSYAQAPPWVRYGIALQLSGFGELYARRSLLDTDKSPLQMARPLGDSAELAWVDGYWAAKAFVAAKGDDALRNWIEAMRSSMPWDRALLQAGGESPQDYNERYQAWIKAHLRDLCVSRDAFREAVALLRQQREKEAVVLLEAFVKDRPLDLYNGNARYYLNYARYRLGYYDRAIEGFTDLLVNFTTSTSWQAKAHYFMGRSYQLSGYGPLAQHEYELSLLAPDDPLLVKLAHQRLSEIK
jgi:tetratricopeptide (TPR) repeat protein